MWPRPPLMSQPTDAPHFPLNCCLIINTPKKEIHLLLRLQENMLFENFVVGGSASLIVNTRARTHTHAHTHAQMATIKGGGALIWICVQSSQASPRLLITLRLPAGAFRSSCSRQRVERVRGARRLRGAATQTLLRGVNQGRNWQLRARESFRFWSRVAARMFGFAPRVQRHPPRANSSSNSQLKTGLFLCTLKPSPVEEQKETPH